MLKVRPAIGYSLKAAPADASVQIQARKNGTADAFVDLAASPIDLSALPPEVGVNYDFRAVVIAATLVDVRRLAIFLSVTSAGAVGW